MNVYDFNNIGSVILARCESEKDKVGFTYKKDGQWVNVTFGEQIKIIEKLSVALQKLGIQKQDSVAIIADTSIEWGQFDNAILGCGGKTIPVYPTNTPDDVAYILEHSEAKLIFVDSFLNLQKVFEAKKSCPYLKGAVVNFDCDLSNLPEEFAITKWDDLIKLGEKHVDELKKTFQENMRSATPEDIFTICYTSGTTGKPKGVILDHGAMKSAVQDAHDALNKSIDESEVLLSYLPMSHIFGKFESFLPYYLNIRQAFVENIDTILNDLTDIKPTIWFSVPRLFEKIYVKVMANVNESNPIKRSLFNWALDVGARRLHFLEKSDSIPFLLEAEYALASKLVFRKIRDRFGGRIKFCISGGAPLPKEIATFMFAIDIPVYQGYGLTETCAPVSVNVPGKNKLGSVGQPTKEVLVKIAEDGEILLKTRKNFVGYYKNEEATAEVLKDGWFYTGDIGCIDKDGYLVITDRKKDLIKTAGGKYVAPQKIENLAKTSKYLNQVVCYGDQKPYITALITLNEDAITNYAAQHSIEFQSFTDLVSQKQIKDLIEKSIQELNDQLPRWETIKRFHLLDREFTVENGELTPSLKIKRKHLVSLYKNQLDQLYL